MRETVFILIAEFAGFGTGALHARSDPFIRRLLFPYSIVNMRANSWSAWSILLITLSILSSLVLAGGYEEPIHIAFDHRSELLRDGTFPNILKEVLRGQHHLPVAPFPRAEVAYMEVQERYNVQHQTKLNNNIIGYLREYGDIRRLIILGAPSPRDASQRGYSVAFHTGTSRSNPNQHAFSFLSVQHVPGQVPIVRIRGTASVYNVPGLNERLDTRNLLPTTALFLT